MGYLNSTATTFQMLVATNKANIEPGTRQHTNNFNVHVHMQLLNLEVIDLHTALEENNMY